MVNESLAESKPKAVVLVSGGLDSATTLAIAIREGYDCFALSFDYGQRHFCELDAAAAVVKSMPVKQHKVFKLDLSQFGGSALTDNSIEIPKDCSTQGIPVTYVPARNTIFLSCALAWAEVLNAENIFIGVNAVDYSGYPDCRPEYIAAFESMANLATKLGTESGHFKIQTPLIEKTKGQIILLGLSLHVDYRITVSCYDPDDQGNACGHCESCRIRAEGFGSVGVDDPTRYQ